MSKSKRLAIISSFDDACGNATYADLLCRGFNRVVPTEIVGIDHFLLGLRGKKAVALGDRHIEMLAEKIAHYEWVNLQFEYSLFGFYPWDVVRRFKKLVDAAPNLVITFHRMELPRPKPGPWGIYDAIVHADFNRYRRDVGMSEVYLKLMGIVERAGRSKNVHCLVHTEKERKKALVMAPKAKVANFPLTYCTPEERAGLIARKDPAGWRLRQGLPENAKVVGLFGFISKYKNFETPLRALRELGPEWHAVIFGSHHPMSFEENVKILPYLRKLIELIEKPDGTGNLTSRVHFAGLVADPVMYEAIVNSDVVVLPYLEVGQGMSGIAALCLELKANVIFSNNHSFNELNRYQSEVARLFDMGNYVELAQKIPRLQVDETLERRLDAYYETYNLEKNIAFHLGLFQHESFRPPAPNQ